MNKDAAAVTLMTIHSAKGLEFPIVFLPGMEENIFPGPKSIGEEAELEEERRLAYVAVTRAKEKLYISHTHSRLLFGRTSYNQLSRFASEIPDNIVNHEGEPGISYLRGFDNDYSQERQRFSGTGFSRAGKASPLTDNRPSGTNISSFMPKVSQVASIIYSPGDYVEHPIFGKGFIMTTKAIGADTLYEIAFDNVGTKKIMASYAKLKPCSE